MYTQYHFIGIGGIGMSGIAQLLLQCGVKVTGSDLRENRLTQELQNQGAVIFFGHRPEHIRGAEVVVYSSAIASDNPEMVEAKRTGVLLLQRAQALASLMSDKRVVAVSGSHGKTTTTSLVSYLLIQAGFSPSVAIGGVLKNIGTNACQGKGEFFVAEADESDGSFLHYTPAYSIVTNIDHEHLDYYKDFQNEVEAFKRFLDNTKKDGCVFCCMDDANLRMLAKACGRKTVLFGLRHEADIYPSRVVMNGLSSDFDCNYQGERIGRFHLALGGMHNISNALAVIALGLELGIKPSVIKETLSGYKGAGRRIEVKAEGNDLMIIDDYAHHPTEIRATLAAIKQLNPRRLIAVFQPHRYTRTKNLLEEFVHAFDAADKVFITDIYAASEPPIEGVTAMRLCQKMRHDIPGKDVAFIPKENIVQMIPGLLLPGDILVTLGAGDITKISDELAEKVSTHEVA